MALTIVQEYKGSLAGMLKIIIYKITDSTGDGGTVNAAVNHICWAGATNLTKAVFMSTIWTNDSETITLGAEGDAGDVIRLVVLGWGG